MQQIQGALGSANSLLRTGHSGFLLDGAKLDIGAALGPLAPNPPAAPQRSSPVTFPAPVQAPPLPGPTVSHPVAAVEVHDTTTELLARVAELLKTVEDLKAENSKLESEKGDLLGKLAHSEDALVSKLKEADELQSLLDTEKRNAHYIKEQLDESKRNLAQAKEMWMKESSRATKLREQLDKAEDIISEKDKELGTVSATMRSHETENVNLKHILSRSNMGTAPDNFAPSDSYFNLQPVTTAKLNNPLFTQFENGSPALTTSSPSASVSYKYLQLCLTNDGVLFEDEIIQVGVKAKFTGLGEAVLGIYYGNKTSGILQNVQTKFVDVPMNLHLTASPIPTQLGPKSQVCQRLSAQISGPFDQPPKCTLSFLLPDNTPRLIPLRLPVTLAKFTQARTLSTDEFFSNWRQQLFLLNEASTVVNVALNLAQIARLACLAGALALHHQVDESPDNLVLAGQFPSDSPDGVRCATIPESLVLVRIEVGAAQFAGKARISVRSNDPTVAAAIKVCIAAQITANRNV